MGTPDPMLQAWMQDALSHHAAGNRSAALLSYRRVLSRYPEFAEAWTNCSTLLRESGRPSEALEAADEALHLKPGDADALANRGNALGDLERWGEAVAAFRQALEHCPDHPGARVNLGWALFREGRLPEALDSDAAAVAAHPELPEAHLNHGYTLMKSGKLAAAEAAFLQSLALAESNPLSHWNLAFVRLLRGRWAEAWPWYAARRRLPEAQKHARTFDAPEWQGEDLSGKTLLVWAEQGYGDTIQFVRFLPQVQARGARVILQAQGALLGVLSTCAGIDLLLEEHEPPPPFDCQVPILSLPAVLGTTLADLPGEIPYLGVPKDLWAAPPAALAEALAPEAGRLRVGLAWAGNPIQKDNTTRSIDPSLLEPLASLPGVRWFSLQKTPPDQGVVSLPEAFQATDLAPHLATFSETAWAMSHLDFMITVDSAPAHLAGALGLPTACLLSFSPDWRWLWGREDCPFYPTMKLYRQPDPGAWVPVIQRLREDLA